MLLLAGLTTESDLKLRGMYKHKNDFVTESKVTNIFIDIFTTAWAHLELYNALHLVGEYVLYIDMDFCVFPPKPGCLQPPLGDYLGKLTNEVIGEYREREHILQTLFEQVLRIMLIELIM